MKKAKGTTAMGEAGFLEAMVNGDWFTRLSLLVPGLGNIKRGQIAKGLMFLGITAAYIIYFWGTGIHG